MSDCLECLYRKKHTPAMEGRPWCAKCAPVMPSAGPGVEHGYYLAATGKEYGDPGRSAWARRAWEHHVRNSGRDWEALPPGRFDGISIFGDVWRLTVQDFSSPTADTVRASPLDLPGLFRTAVLELP